MQEIIIGSYNKLCEQNIALQNENRILRQALNNFCLKEKTSLEEILKEMEDFNVQSTNYIL